MSSYPNGLANLAFPAKLIHPTAPQDSFMALGHILGVMNLISAVTAFCPPVTILFILCLCQLPFFFPLKLSITKLRPLQKVWTPTLILQMCLVTLFSGARKEGWDTSRRDLASCSGPLSLFLLSRLLYFFLHLILSIKTILLIFRQ